MLYDVAAQVLLGGWRKSRSWVMEVFLIVVLALLSPIVLSLDTESGFLSPSKRVLELRELGMLANYPGYQAILPPFKRNGGGGLNFKRNGGVPDECRGKYDTSIYTQVVTSSSKDVTKRALSITKIVKQNSTVKMSFDYLYPFQKLCLPYFLLNV